jgi:hypothetical protein
MDRRERSGDLLAGLLALQQSWAGELYVALPGIVQSFDPAKRTCVVQPAVKANVMTPDGSSRWDTMPLLLDCPVVFPGGGDVVLTFPLKLGDEVLVIFSDRCIDAWWQNGGLQNQAEFRMHDLSDGYCIPGPSSVPRVEASINPTKATLRSRDGVTFISVDPVGHEIDVITTGVQINVKPNEVDVITPGAQVTAKTNEVDVDVGSSHVAVKPLEIDLTVGASSISMTPSGLSMATTACSISVTGGQVAVTGALVINGNPFVTHHHSGVTTGGGTTGDVV